MSKNLISPLQWRVFARGWAGVGSPSANTNSYALGKQRARGKRGNVDFVKVPLIRCLRAWIFSVALLCLHFFYTRDYVQDCEPRSGDIGLVLFLLYNIEPCYLRISRNLPTKFCFVDIKNAFRINIKPTDFTHALGYW